MNGQPRFTALGKLVSVLLVVGLIGLGVYMIQRGRGDSAAPPPTTESGGAADVVDFKAEVPRLSPPAPFQFKDNIVPIEISEYAGYAGLIAANGGLEPNENSIFFKNHGFKVQADDQRGRVLVRAERRQDRGVGDDGRRAGGVRQAAARRRAGADRLLPRRGRDRRPQRHQADQSAEGQDDRHGAVHRGGLLHPLPRAGGGADDQHARQPRRRAASGAAEPRLHRGRIRRRRSVPEGHQVGQEPARRLRDVGAESLGGRGRQRRSGARAHDEPQPADHRRRPDRSPRLRGAAAQDRRRPRAGTARRQPHGARSARPVSGRDRPRLQVEPRRHEGRARERSTCRTCRRTSRSSPARSTRPAASAESISRRSSPTAATSSRIRPTQDGLPASPRCRRSRRAGCSRTRRSRSRRFAAGGSGSVEADPLLSKDIRFLFEPNSATLDQSNQENLRNLEAIKRLVQVSPGSTLLLRGHVDNAMVAEFRKQGGETSGAHDGAERDGAEQETARRRSGSS